MAYAAQLPGLQAKSSKKSTRKKKGALSPHEGGSPNGESKPRKHAGGKTWAKAQGLMRMEAFIRSETGETRRIQERVMYMGVADQTWCG
jgi:hypothetical protein